VGTTNCNTSRNPTLSNRIPYAWDDTDLGSGSHIIWQVPLRQN